MEPKQFDHYHRRRPFRPFRIFMTDGRSFLIEHAEYVARAPNSMSAAIYDIEHDVLETIDLVHITGMKETGNQEPDWAGRPRRPGNYPRPGSGSGGAGIG